ncbi:MAG: cation:proton antiporter [Gemmatimonadetes bacterium]|nr:cation:proton antiporter [Gemmatimonadota bacterium]
MAYSLLASVTFSLPMTHPVFIVAVAMLIFLLAPLLMQKLRIPGIIGIIIAGAIVGPNGLNLLARSNTIILLGTVGLLYLMFLAGIEIDLHGFKRHRNRSLVFGTLSFVFPQVIGTAVGLLLGYTLPASILLGSVLSSHTLLAYPIARRQGISRNASVTTAVGGTIITDTAALLVLVIVSASTRGALDAAFWLQLVGALGIYVVAVVIGLPRLGRWFFRSRWASATTDFIFVLTALFAGAFLAEVAGVEGIIGAFLVGLALNRLLPEQSPLTNRIHFVGESIFIPFFLLAVGMLVDVRVFAGSVEVWQVMFGMTTAVIATKWLAARVAQHLYDYSPEETWTTFGLTIPQAAATLAATLIGYELRLFGDAVLNGAIMMILVTCILGPWVVARYGQQLAAHEERKPYDPRHAPQRILIPIANPTTADLLLQLTLLIREPDSDEPLYPITVVPSEGENSAEQVAFAEKMLSHAVAYAAGADVPVVPLTRVDHDFASGIARGMTETRITTVVTGWDGRPSDTGGMFGSVLDPLLEQTRQRAIIARLMNPLNTTHRVVLLIPRGLDRLPGFPATVRTIKLMANRLGASILGFVVVAWPEPYQEQFEVMKPDVPTNFVRIGEWDVVLRSVQDNLGADDLLIVLTVRQSSPCWHPAMEHLPGQFAQSVSENLVVLFLSEIERPAGARHSAATA